MTLIVALLSATFPPRELAGQTDSIGTVFRDAIVKVAEAGRMARLDSANLPGGVNREVRVYTGFGIGIPHEVVRLWQDSSGTHGVFGVFWRATLPEGLDSATVQQFERTMRAFVDSSYQCRDILRSATTNVCWLPPRRSVEDWSEVMSQLDRFGVDTIPMPTNRRIGRDGCTVLIEVRTRLRYRAYSYWLPSATAVDPGERAAAGIVEAVGAAWKRRLRE